MNYDDYVSRLQNNINERVFSERDRFILTLKYVKGKTYNEIASSRYEYPIINIDVRQIRRICKKYETRIYKGLKCPYIDH